MFGWEAGIQFNSRHGHVNLLIDIGHPAHVHFFRFAIREWQKHGHHVEITVRRKAGVTALLEQFQLPYIVASEEWRGGIVLLTRRFLEHAWKIRSIAIRSRADLILSISSPMAAWASLVSGVPHIAFDDTEHAHLEHALYAPGSRRIYTPTSFTKDFGRKQVRYPGFHELAYLHPNWFTPNSNVLREARLSEHEPFFVVRTVSWNAAHDRGQRGLSKSDANDLLRLLRKHGKVAISTEAERNIDVEGVSIHPSRMHDLLYYAAMYIGEGGTMATEAALLGTPSIFVNTLAAGNWVELEQRYDLMYSFQSGPPAIAKVAELLNQPSLRAEWSQKRLRLLADKIDVTEYLVKEIESFLRAE
jgi:predicted glycosyltransferase